MIEWMRRIDPSRPFLVTDEWTWSYGEALFEVENRLDSRPRLIAPSLNAEDTFDVVAGIMGGGITVVGPDPETSVAAEADLVVFTSGSTGEPKGVRLTKANLEAAARASAEHLGHGPDDNWLLAMPLNHVGGLSVLVRQLFTGGSVTLQDGFHAEAAAQAMKAQVTMVSVVPTMLLRLLDFGPFQGLRAVLVGGGPIPEGLLEQGAEAGLPVLPTYGMTETFGQVATLRPDAAPERKAHPLPGIDIRIEGDGRIAIRGDQVSPGYLDRPDRRDTWFVTNDLGELDEEGALRVIGRADTIIITGGENVNPERVEQVLRGHPGVTDVVVFGIPDEQWGERISCAYVGTAPAEELEVHARKSIPAFMVPKEWARVDAIPKTAIGKPDRAAASGLGAGGGG